MGCIKLFSGSAFQSPKSTHMKAMAIIGISIRSGASLTSVLSSRFPKNAAWPNFKKEAAVRKDPSIAAK
jgi:hypothetical protein